MRKGGYRGHISEETRMKVNVVRFQSDKVLMSHQVHLASFPDDTLKVHCSILDTQRFKNSA